MRASSHDHRGARPERVLLLFVDGVGVGRRDPAVNPFARLERTLLGRYMDEISVAMGPQGAEPLPLAYGGLWRPIDATLGVPGLPQSATGQASILSGLNVPRLVGRHVSALPDRSVRAILEETNLFIALARAGRAATFANAYTPTFFTRKRPRKSATTCAVLAAGFELRRIEDIAARRAVFHDYTNGVLPDRPASLPERTADEAADVLLALAGEHDFVLHEHFLTDLAGHRGSSSDRLEAARRIEALVEAVARRAGEAGLLFVVVSDHGNLEDATTRDHTLNPVPIQAWGPGSERVARSVQDLTGVAPAILDALGV